MRVTLRDVAEFAGVSVKTVSNVVNDYEHVTDETRQRVKRALAELGYEPNLPARSLRTGRTNVIALAVPRLQEQYFAELADHVVHAAERQGYTVLVDNTDGRHDQERQVASGARARFVDGLVFSPLALASGDLQEIVGAVPTVLLGERHGAVGATDHVGLDNVTAARVATEHVLELGRRRIAMIGTHQTKGERTAALRLAGYEQALRAAKIPLDPRILVPVERFHRPDGAAAMSQLLDLADPPDAVFCLNDALALGALRMLHERGVQVPADVAVVGFDDIEDGRYSVPTLTTVAPDKDELATLAVDALITRITARYPAPPQELVASFTLIERESTIGRYSGRA